MSKSQQLSKSSRKQRIVKNALVEIEDIISNPGHNFSNWIPAVQNKLQQRETVLIEKRLGIVRNTIISSMTQFIQQNKQHFKREETINVDRMNEVNLDVYHQYITDKILNNIVLKCGDAINEQLQNWKGIKRTKKDITVFRKYFRIAKSWFDNKKIGILAISFWFPLFDLIEKFTKKAASDFFCARLFDLQHKYSNYLYTLILQNMFNETIDIANSRPMHLIPARSYLKFIPKVIDKQDNNNNNNVMSGYKPNNQSTSGETIRKQVVASMTNNRNIYQQEFQTTLLNLHVEVENYGKNIGNVEPPSMQSNNGNLQNNNSYFCVHCQCNIINGFRYRPY